MEAKGQTKLPEKRPLDFSLHSKYDGGMSYHFSELYISQDSCVFMENKRGKKTEKRFKLSAKQLDAIYASLLKTNLTKSKAIQVRQL